MTQIRNMDLAAAAIRTASTRPVAAPVDAAWKLRGNPVPEGGGERFVTAAGSVMSNARPCRFHVPHWIELLCSKPQRRSLISVAPDGTPRRPGHLLPRHQTSAQWRNEVVRVAATPHGLPPRPTAAARSGTSTLPRHPVHRKMVDHQQHPTGGGGPGPSSNHTAHQPSAAGSSRHSPLRPYRNPGPQRPSSSPTASPGASRRPAIHCAQRQSPERPFCWLQSLAARCATAAAAASW